MRVFLSFSTLIVYMAAFVAAGNLKVQHRPSFHKHRSYARGITESLVNRNATEDNTGIVTRNLEKRFEGMKFTFYDAGLGACGRYNTNSDFVSRIELSLNESFGILTNYYVD